MPDPLLSGDSDALYMACPAGPAAELASLLPAGPVLELCCGIGGLTRELARAGRRVLAVDKDLARLKANRTNLAALGLEDRGSYLCCDLRRPALGAPQDNATFAAAVLDPDWSPPGAPPDAWATNLADMDPPADELIDVALRFSPLVAMRLPRDMRGMPDRLVASEMGRGGTRWRWLALRRA